MSMFNIFGLLNFDFLNFDVWNVSLKGAVNFATQNLALMVIFLAFMVGMVTGYVFVACTWARRLPQKHAAY